MMTTINWNKVLDGIPDNASEVIVNSQFVSVLIEALGFTKNEMQFPQFPTGRNARVNASSYQRIFETPSSH